MEAVQSKKTILLNSLTPEGVLAKWSAAVAALHLNYQQLTRRINTFNKERVLSSGHSLWVGRCPIRQCLLLTNRMQTELEKLLVDLDENNLLEQSTSSKHFRKLVAHTIRMDQLNQQAQTLLHLASLPILSSSAQKVRRKNR